MRSCRTWLSVFAVLCSSRAFTQSIKTVSVTPATVKGGAGFSGTVSLDRVAPGGGSKVALTSSNPAASVPVSVSIGTGQTTASFVGSSTAVPKDTAASITAKIGTSTRATNLTVLAPKLLSLSASPTSLLAGTVCVATVTVDAPAPVGGAVIKLTSSSPAVLAPPTITIPVGKLTASIDLPSIAVKSVTTVTIKASLGTMTKAVIVTVNPMPVSIVGNAKRYQRAELRIDAVPPTASPFDPDRISVDATITSPTKKVQIVPAFLMQDYSRSRVATNEVLSVLGGPQWRVRFYPTEQGNYQVAVSVKLNKTTAGGAGLASVTVGAGTKPAGPGGYVVGSTGSFLLSSTGEPVPLIGQNLCWFDGQHGTYDYDTWLASMKSTGENFARVWMCPWSMGLEVEPGSLNNYRLDHAWQLDQVIDNADRSSIYVQLCLDYHGMFETQPDYWGGNNFWTINPYNMAKGGPCANQREFFTSVVAKATYKKRLRYLIARYGYSPHLLAWEFFNEIDGVYRYLDSGEVAAWHDEMSKWMSSQDPFHHLLTTSYVGTDHPEIWNLAKIGIVEIHPYAYAPTGTTIANLITKLHTQFNKPVLAAEFGTDWRGWNRSTVDPFLRGFRQGIWAAAMAPSAGSAMSWWWEDIHSENDYVILKAMKSLIGGTAWGSGPSTPISISGSGEFPGIGSPIPGATPFTATIPLDSDWGAMVSGQLAVTSPAQVDRGKTNLNAFVQGSGHADLRRPFQMRAWFGEGALLTIHLNSVSDDSIMQVLVDDKEAFRWVIPNKDGKWEVNHEYDSDINVAIPAGLHTVEIRNAGVDWFFLDWVRLTVVRPATYSSTPIAIGHSYGNDTLVYCYNPAIDFPNNALGVAPAVSGSMITITVPAAGTYTVTWSKPIDGSLVSTTLMTATTKQLTIPVPTYTEDLFLRVLKK